MQLQNIKIIFALTGSYCVFDQVIPQVEALVQEGAEVYPLVTETVAVTDTRYGKAQDFMDTLTAISGKPVIKSIVDTEPLGVVYPVDLAILSPCTGNTLSKLASGATDSAALMAAKGMFRNHKPVVIGIATNDGLGVSARNLGTLLSTKNVYFIPFGQDNCKNKPDSLVAKFELTVPTVVEALKGNQLQPVLVEY